MSYSKCGRCVADKSLCETCIDNPKYKDLTSHFVLGTTRLYYGTFGCGHPIHAGKVQVILATNIDEAREIMFAMHGKHFCTVYTEAEWKSIEDRGFGKEIPLEHIASVEDIEFTEYHTDYTGTEYELKRDYGG
jgi:hypothetical protein